jgi:aminoglycoside 6'-N-acetyltransferase I
VNTAKIVKEFREQVTNGLRGFEMGETWKLKRTWHRIAIRMAEEDDSALLIRPVGAGDAKTWVRLRCELWPDGQEDHAREIAGFFAGALPEPEAVLVVERSEGEIIAFAELSVRMDLPSLEGERVGYVEGLYVIPRERNHGVARALLQASRKWAREQNCTACASDRAERVIIDSGYRVDED